MHLRRFTARGFEEFMTFREKLVETGKNPPPLEILEDPELTELVPGAAVVENRTFASRMDAGIYLNDVIDKTAIKRPERDKGLWAWLTLFYFDEVCPKDGNGIRKPLGLERLIPLVDNFQRFYRHLLLGPFCIVRAHRDNPNRAIAILCGPLWKPGEIVGQIAASQELVTNNAVVEVASRLYYDPKSSQFKRGAGSSVRGAPRRLADLLNQLDLTFYLYGMKPEELLSLLPKEFDRFRTT